MATVDFHGLSVEIVSPKGTSKPTIRGNISTKWATGVIAHDDKKLHVIVGPVLSENEVYVVRDDKEKIYLIGFESEKQAKIAAITNGIDHSDTERLEETTAEKLKNVAKALSNPNYSAEQIPNNASSVPNPIVPSAQSGILPLSPSSFGMNMNPMMGMGMMGPPPIDVESFEGVNQLLGRVGSMKDNELVRVASEIWGPGYQFVNATPNHVRVEVVGFLLDQRDLLGVSFENPETAGPSSSSTAGSGGFGETTSAAENSSITTSPGVLGTSSALISLPNQGYQPPLPSDSTG
jgi:hypothetical protein